MKPLIENIGMLWVVRFKYLVVGVGAMIVRFLGIMDLFAGVMLFLLRFSFGEGVGGWLGIYLIVKGIVFISNFVSVMDILAGIMMVLAANDLYFSFTWIFVLWLLQKGFFSFFS